MKKDEPTTIVLINFILYSCEQFIFTDVMLSQIHDDDQEHLMEYRFIAIPCNHLIVIHMIVIGIIITLNDKFI